MFKITWRIPMIRTRYRTVNGWTTGLTTYATLAMAEKQANLFKSHFPNNDYSVVTTAQEVK